MTNFEYLFGFIWVSLVTILPLVMYIKLMNLAGVRLKNESRLKLPSGFVATLIYLNMRKCGYGKIQIFEANQPFKNLEFTLDNEFSVALKKRQLILITMTSIISLYSLAGCFWVLTGLILNFFEI